MNRSGPDQEASIEWVLLLVSGFCFWVVAATLLPFAAYSNVKIPFKSVTMLLTIVGRPVD